MIQAITPATGAGILGLGSTMLIQAAARYLEASNPERAGRFIEEMREIYAPPEVKRAMGVTQIPKPASAHTTTHAIPATTKVEAPPPPPSATEAPSTAATSTNFIKTIP